MKALETLAHLGEYGTPPGDGADLLKVSAGLQQAMDRAARETLPFIAAGGGDLQFVHGPYGRGKTHFLKALVQLGQAHGFVTAFVDCHDDLNPFQDLDQTYRAIAERMAPPSRTEDQQFFATSGVGRVIEASFAGRDDAARRELVKGVRNDKTLAADYRNLVLAYRDIVFGSDDEELAERLEALLAARTTYRVTLGELYEKHRDLPRPLGKLGKRNAAIWLRALLSLPRVLGYAGLLVLFDETETALLRGGRRQHQKRLAHLRTFIDHLATGAFRGCGVYYAVTQDFSYGAETYLQALSQRIERLGWKPGDPDNPRAVLVDLDELTVPGPEQPAFYEELARRIVEIGREAGLKPTVAKRIMRDLEPLVSYYALESIDQGAVREYVKIAATSVVQGLSARERKRGRR